MEQQGDTLSAGSRPLRLIRLAEVKFRTGLSRSTIYRRMEEGTFPRSRSLGGSIVAWAEHEIDHWIARAIQNPTTRG